MKRAIVFTGIKHSGKTLFASLTADSLSLPFFDTDALILDRIEEKTIREYYIKHGKDAFMEEERKAYERAFLLSSSSPFIISLGGGSSDNTPLMEEIKRNGDYVVYLKRDEKLILPRILKDGVPPFLDKDNIESSFHTLYERRDRIYKEYSSLIIDLGSYGDKKEKCNLIVSTLKEEFNEW